MPLEVSYCFCSTDKTKTRSQMRGKFEHNMRLRPVDNADPEKRGENEILIGDPSVMDIFNITQEEAKQNNLSHQYKSYADYAEETKKLVESETKRKVRSDAVAQIEVVLTYSSSKTNLDVDAWKQANVEWLKHHFGEENIVNAVLHKDETSPHIHAIVTPLDRETGIARLNSKKWIGGKAVLAKMQTEYAEYMKPFGLSRGEENSRASHRDLQDFYHALQNIVRIPAPKREDYLTDEEYDKAVEEINRKYHISMFALQEKLNRLEIVSDTRDSNLELFRAQTDKAIKERQSEIELLRTNYESVKRKASVVDKIQLALEEMQKDNAKEAERIRNELNEQIKRGDEIEKKRKKEKQQKSEEENRRL